MQAKWQSVLQVSVESLALGHARQGQALVTTTAVVLPAWPAVLSGRLFVYAWVLVEPHHHQAFAYLQMNLLYMYDVKKTLYNIVWNFQLPAITQRTIPFLIVNLRDLLSSNPTRSRLWAFDCSRSYKPLDLRKRMSCTAQFHLNHYGFLNDLKLKFQHARFLQRIYPSGNISRKILWDMWSVSRLLQTLYRWICEWWSSRIGNHLWYHHKNSSMSSLQAVKKL